MESMKHSFPITSFLTTHLLSTDIFTHPYNEEWKANKKIAVQCLRASGYGTRKAEGKIVGHMQELLDYIDKQDGNYKVMTIIP